MTDNTEIVTPDQVKRILENDATVILDVRGPEEILESGYLKTKRRSDGRPHRWVQLACTRTEAPLLEMTMSALIGETDTPVLVYCQSGKRAALAKSVLEKGGYTNVYNAGGYSDVKQFVSE